MKLSLLICLGFLFTYNSAEAQGRLTCGGFDCPPPANPLARQTEDLKAVTEEMVRPTPRPAGLRTTRTTSTARPGLVTDRFVNSRGCFSRNRRTSDNCAPSGWNSMSLVDRAKYVFSKYEELTRAHKLDYSPRILTCKVMRESTFRPQDQAGSSTASGLSQVTKTTARDLFNRGRWFSSKVSGFQDIKSADTYFDKMKTSVVAQMELGLAVIHQKSRDTGSKSVKTILARYYGTSSSRQNNHYAQKIYDCAACIQNNRNNITETCLMKAKD